jgi:DNA-binding MarR family transcriptional regulator
MSGISFSGSSDDERDALWRVIGLLRQFTVDITAVMDAAVGTSYSDNRQSRAALHLTRHGAVGLRELAEVSGLSRRALDHLLAEWREAGTVVRVRDPRDRRTLLVRPTSRGRRSLDVCRRRMGALFVAHQRTAKEIVDELDHHVLDDSDQTPPTDETDVIDLAIALTRVGDVIDDRHRAATRGHVPRRRALLALLVISERGGEIRPSDLAEALTMTSGGTTYLLNQLEQRRLIRRAHGRRDDRRAVVVTLTPAGTRAVDAFFVAVHRAAPEIRQVFLAVRDFDQQLTEQR